MTTFDRANSDVPGASGDGYLYAQEPTGNARLYVWRPSGSYTGAPVLVCLPDDLWHDNGDAVCSIESWGGDHQGVADALSTLGWVVVCVDTPPGPSFKNSKDKENWAPAITWPEPEQFVAAAIAHIKDNWCGISGALLTTFGATLWGSGNSIDPNQVVLYGVGTGGTSALWTALIPSSGMPHFSTGITARTRNRYMPRSSHRVRAVIACEGCPDWSQFDVQTAQVDDVRFSQDVHPHFFREATKRTWSTYDLRVKKAASPYWWIAAAIPENRSLPVYLRWVHSTDADGANLTSVDWSPGTRLSDTGAGKAYRDPEHHFVTIPMHAAVMANLDPASLVYGGNSSDNPETPAKTGQAYIDEVVAWLGTTLGLGP